MSHTETGVRVYLCMEKQCYGGDHYHVDRPYLVTRSGENMGFSVVPEKRPRPLYKFRSPMRQL